MVMELAETGEYSHDHKSQWSLEHLQVCLYYIRLAIQTMSTSESLIYYV